MIKANTRVNTPLGPGKLVSIELPESGAWRYGVELDINVYDYKPNIYCFIPREVTEL